MGLVAAYLMCVIIIINFLFFSYPAHSAPPSGLIPSNSGELKRRVCPVRIAGSVVRAHAGHQHGA